jgi:lipoprotein-anchoring transpeptidase ErfK/SrfK
VVSFICSPGTATPTGTFKIKDKLRWHELMGQCWGQWCEHLTDDILFHSVYYDKQNDNKSLNVAAYNKLGTVASHGCIRLTAGDAKWIYDNCDVGTEVKITTKKKSTRFDKPKAQKLSSRHTWDPTDPNIK